MATNNSSMYRPWPPNMRFARLAPSGANSSRQWVMKSSPAVMKAVWHRAMLDAAQRYSPSRSQIASTACD
jgi:hypothetical protein